MTNRIHASALALCLSCTAGTSRGEPAQTLLLRDPTVSAAHVVFVYAGDLWRVDRDGGNPLRLTADAATDGAPVFSPDGRWLAFERFAAGNHDVYVVPAEGGAPRRLTWHPRSDRVAGWSADGQRVLFASAREVAPTGYMQAWEIAPAGGAARKVMEADFARGRWNGDRLAYIPFAPAYDALLGGGAGWKGYRGGLAPAVHLIDLAAGTLDVVPGERASHIEPLWVGGRLHFIADRDDAAFNLYAWDEATRSARRLTDERPWDVRAADAHGDAIVYEAGGRLKELDTRSGAVREIVVRLPADLPETLPRWAAVGDAAEDLALSPGGKRVLLTARGEVFSVPAKDGSVRNLTRSVDEREYTALWSPKGDRVAWVVQQADGQSLVVRDQAGLEPPRSWPLGDGFHRLAAFAPDGQRIAYTDQRLALWVIALADGKRTRIDAQHRRADAHVAFSPDSRWLAYTVSRPNFLSDLVLAELDGSRRARIGDGMADLTEAAFSPDGKYLYFAASTNAGPHKVSLDLSSQEQNERRTFYAVVLASDGESPLAPRTADEEPAKDAGDADGKDDDGGDEAPKPTRVDLDGIARRVVAIPLAERNYRDLAVAKDGDLLFIDAVQAGASAPPDGESEEAGNRLRRYDFEKREVGDVAAGVSGFVLSADGEHLLLRDGEGALKLGKLADAETTFEALDVSGVKLRIDPRREWRQIFEDAVRMQRAYFYAPNLHGLDWDGVAARFRPLVDHVARRVDLNALLLEMIAELRAGHNFLFGGDQPQVDGDAAAGLLGADLRVENGQWRIARVLEGANWIPFSRAPLRRPGLQAGAGDYILAINGTPLTGADDIHARMAGTVDAQTTLTLAADPGGKDKRNVVVEPIADESELRLWDWVEKRRARVEAATGGRVGYVYLPNTTTEGYRFFNRMFYAQVDKQALVIDERANGGGQAANYITDVLGATRLSGWLDREGAIFETPGGAVHGPKVMLIDQYAGSGGDFLPYAFRREGLGKLVGTRTWGGLIGIYANPAFVDGGVMTVPFFRFFTPEGAWAIENEGVAPDIEVALDPLAFNRGEDSQLEAAIREILAQLQASPPRPLTAPPLPTEPGR